MGVIIGLIVFLVLKSLLKTGRKQDQADAYVKPGSMRANIRNDYLRYRTVTDKICEGSQTNGVRCFYDAGIISFAVEALEETTTYEVTLKDIPIIYKTGGDPMKRLCVYILILTILLSFAACGEKGSIDDKINNFSQPATTPESADALSAFRAEMQPPVAAVADFGLPDLSEGYDIMDYLLEEYPSWMAEHDFIRNMPQERIVYTCSYDYWAELLCIVPRDPEATILVEAIRYMDEEPYAELGTEEVYRSEDGDPILLWADTSDTNRITVTVTEKNGRSVSFSPFWDYLEDTEFRDLIMDFTPESEKSAYEKALEFGWIVPDDSFRRDHYWESYFGYDLELIYEPGQYYDGSVFLSRYEEEMRVGEYYGNWSYWDGMLYLKMEHAEDSSLVIEAEFPVLTDPYGEDSLIIFRAEDGTGLPYFYEDMESDDFVSVSLDSEDPYQYNLSQGWYVPELWELMDTEWLSQTCYYAMDLTDDSVPDDNGGWAVIYDEDFSGAYTTSYTGSWWYEDGMLHLSLVPEYGDGYFIDESFPVLMRDGELWIGRNDYGSGLPHFYSDQLADTLEQPMG